jgi:hypothetical protein
MPTTARARSDAIVIPLRPPRNAPLAPGFVVPVADKVSAICFDDSRPASARARLHAELDGKALSRRLVSTALPLMQSGRRQVLLVGLPAATITGSRVDLALGRQPAAAIDPDWLESPLADAAALTDGLSDEGCRRLLALLVTTGASLFGAHATAGFAAVVDRLFELLGVPALAPASWCPIGLSGRLITFRTDAQIDPESIGPLTARSAGHFTRLPACQLASERSGAGGLLHVYIPNVPGGTTLIACGDVPLQFRTPDGTAPGRPLAPWIARRAPATQAWAHGLLEASARTDALAAAQLSEMGVGERAAPRLAIRHLSATKTGLLYAVTLEDRYGLIRGVRVERDGATADIAVAPSARPTRTLAGFVALERPRGFGPDRARFRVIYGSGRIRTVAEGTALPYHGQLPAEFDTGDPAVVSALAGARLSIGRVGRTADCLRLGPQPVDTTLSIVAPVGTNLDLVSARAAMLFGEPGAAETEILYHVEAGPLADAARTAAARAAAIYGLAHRVVVVAPGGDRCDRLLAALAQARGTSMLLLGAAVLPAAPGWLTPWRCRLVAARPMLGGTLIDVAGAVLDAGGSSIEQRRYVGLPEDDLPAVPALATVRATSDCVGITSEVANWLLTAATPYPNPDVMIAEAAAQLAATGREVATLLRSRFLRYAEPSGDGRTECVDIEAMRRLLKGSFSTGAQKVDP